MDIQDFDYSLPAELIAKYPRKNRSAGKLLHHTIADASNYHRQVTDIPNILKPSDVLVLNNTKVLPARLLGHKPTGGKVEVLIEQVLTNNTARAMVKNNHTTNLGMYINIADHILEVISKLDNLYELKLHSEISFMQLLEQYGTVPIPPYLQREANDDDKHSYQTVFAKLPGAIAAPTAGLHFDEKILHEIAKIGVSIEFLTLHIGYGTFAPVKVQDITQHNMHKERFIISEPVAARLNEAIADKRRIIAVGTTVVRALESAFTTKVNAGMAATDIFIYPGYDFKVIDGLFTNFHLPKSTLMMLIAAFAGREQILTMYQEAVAKSYSFFSYGDLTYLER